MRGYYCYTADRLPIDDPKLDNQTAHRQMQVSSIVEWLYAIYLFV
jgi:hypothetical protein